MIYINGRFLTHKMAGIPRFSYEMCKAMHKIGIEIIVVAPLNANTGVQYPFPVVYYGKRKSHFWEQVDLYSFMKKKNKAILVSFSGLGPILYSNHIATIHDISFWRNPQWFSFSYNLIYKFLTPIVAKRAKKIITVSNFSKKEIVECLKISKEKIEVINNAVSQELKENITFGKMQKIKNENYVLMVSSYDPRKNFSRTIEAFLSLNLSNVKLYIIGGSGTVFNNNDQKLIDNSSAIKLLGRVSDEELISYYENALLFVYPSLYEGFGIPPLEAMAAKCPVLVSNIEPLQEVCGDAAFYCDPYDISSIAGGIKILLEDEKLRDILIERGTVREQKYNWKTSAERMKSIL